LRRRLEPSSDDVSSASLRLLLQLDIFLVLFELDVELGGGDGARRLFQRFLQLHILGGQEAGPREAPFVV